MVETTLLTSRKFKEVVSLMFFCTNLTSNLIRSIHKFYSKVQYDASNTYS